MTAVTKAKKQVNKRKNNLFKDYHWFYSNIYKAFQTATNEFFNKEFQLRFMGVSTDENILFYGDEYFVNKVPINKLSDIKLKISQSVISSILDSVLGTADKPFSLNALTLLEANLIKSYTVFLYKNIENFIYKDETNKKVINNSKSYDFTFYIRINNNHSGKIILTIPEYMISEIEPVNYPEIFTISDYRGVGVNLNISAGSSKIKLSDIKAIEHGDIILLENSNINQMAVEWSGKNIAFRINPNPSLIISINNNGDKEMEEETSSKSPNMWDSILVDIVAEFDNVRLTLGELKQISEGLVIDVGSVYDNKIKLRVENQIVATGELVILNDRYGVRVDEVIKSKEKSAQKKPNPNPDAGQQQKAAGTAKAGDENFDYSDFEIEDESI